MAERETDRVAELIPWYATGTLTAQDSARVEEHLPECDACRELLVTARAFRRLAPAIAPQALVDHVQAQLLVEYADDPRSLEPDTRRFITTHLAACRVCAEAVEILEDLGSTAGTIDPATAIEPRSPDAAGPLRRAWRWVTRTLLHPLPALAYLAALVALLAMTTPLRRPASDPQEGRPAVSVLPRVNVLPEELVSRGARDAPPPPIDVVGSGHGLLLELVTSIEAERLHEAKAGFRLEISDESGRVVSESSLRGSDFEPNGRLRLLLDPRGIAAGRVHTVRLTFSKSGDPLDSQEVFRRSFRLVPE